MKKLICIDIHCDFLVSHGVKGSLSKRFYINKNKDDYLRNILDRPKRFSELVILIEKIAEDVNIITSNRDFYQYKSSFLENHSIIGFYEITAKQ